MVLTNLSYKLYRKTLLLNMQGITTGYHPAWVLFDKPPKIVDDLEDAISEELEDDQDAQSLSSF